MNERDRPSNLRSLDTRLRNVARAEGQVEGRVRRAIATSIAGHFLQATKAGLIKGATSLEVRLGVIATRASSDLDAVRTLDLDQFRVAVEDALGEGWQGFSGRLVDRGPIRAPVPDTYRPHRFHIKLDYHSRPFATVELEVAAPEVGALDAADTVALDNQTQQWFHTIGLDPPTSLPLLPLSHQIAQKLHACTTPDTDEWSNDRSHDLVDLQLAHTLVDDDVLAATATVAPRLFAARQRHPWPPTATARAGWREQYLNDASGLPVLQDLEEAIAWTNSLIESIDQVRFSD